MNKPKKKKISNVGVSHTITGKGRKSRTGIPSFMNDNQETMTVQDRDQFKETVKDPPPPYPFKDEKGSEMETEVKSIMNEIPKMKWRYSFTDIKSFNEYSKIELCDVKDYFSNLIQEEKKKLEEDRKKFDQEKQQFISQVSNLNEKVKYLEENQKKKNDSLIKDRENEFKDFIKKEMSCLIEKAQVKKSRIG